jgi:hypothetical protein
MNGTMNFGNPILRQYDDICVSGFGGSDQLSCFMIHESYIFRDPRIVGPPTLQVVIEVRKVDEHQ